MYYARNFETHPGLKFVAEWTTTTRLKTHLEAWRRLATHAVEPNPFYEPDYLLASAEHIEQDEIRCLAIFRDGGRDSDLVGLFPLQRASLMKGALIPAFEFYTNDYICSTAPLIDRDDPVGVWQCFFDMLERTPEAPGVLLAPMLPAARGVYHALERALMSSPRAMTVIERSERAAVESVDDFAAYTKTISSSRLKDLRRRSRRLAELGTIEIRTVDKAEDKPAAFQAFLDLENSGWKGTSGTALASHPQTRQFAEAVFLSHAAEYDVMTMDGRVIAILANLVRNGVVYAVKTAYDESYKAFSPGVMLDLWSIENLVKNKQRYRRLDSCAIPGHPIEAFWREREPLVSLALASRPDVSQSRIDSFARTMLGVSKLKNWVKAQIGARAAE